jgi:hypothetical protein
MAAPIRTPQIVRGKTTELNTAPLGSAAATGTTSSTRTCATPRLPEAAVRAEAAPSASRAYALPVGWMKPPLPSGMGRVTVPCTTPVTAVSPSLATRSGCEWIRVSGAHTNRAARSWMRWTPCLPASGTRRPHVPGGAHLACRPGHRLSRCPSA